MYLLNLARQRDYNGVPEIHHLIWKPNKPNQLALKTAYFDPQKYNFQMFYHFYVNEPFSADTTLCRKSTLISTYWWLLVLLVLVLAWLLDRPISGRKRNLTGSANLITYSLNNPQLSYTNTTLGMLYLSINRY